MFLIPGCILEPGLEDSGKDCSPNGLDGPGFLVRVPETVGNGSNQVRTQGYCVSMIFLDDGSNTLRPVHDGAAWFSVSKAGSYQFTLSIREPQDSYCTFWMEANADHDATGVRTVDLPYDGVSSCA